MDGKIKMALAILCVVLVAGTGVAVMMIDNDNTSAEPQTANVIVETEGGYEKLQGTGNTVREVVENAFETKGYTMDVRSNGNIISVNGDSSNSDDAWLLYHWNSYAGWNAIVFGSTADKTLINGTSYCIATSQITVSDGKTTYASPEYTPINECWFFIAMEDDYNVESVLGVFTESERRNGFWISGEGSDVAKAFVDACEKAELQLSLVYEGDLKGWFGTFLGLEDEQIDSSLWKYWSQYHWDGDSWAYDDFTIGYYDPGVYGYFAFIRQTTTEKGMDIDTTVTPIDCPGWSS